MSEPTEGLQPTEEGFHIAGSFKGHIKYQCNYCPFDALELWRIRDHLINRHQMKVIEEQRTKLLEAKLYDSRGQLIEERELTDAEISFNKNST